MKKYLFNIFCLVLPLYLFADPNCPVVQPAIINPGTSIECWGTDYEECIVQEWDITIPEDYNYVEFEYIIDLNPNGAIDALYIYTEDENHIEREVLNYNYQPMTGRIQVYTSNQVIRIVLVSQYGNSGEMYRGFKLSYRYADTGIADQVIYSNLGIGIQPQERLHVNGPVRGDGESGSWRIRTTSGTTEIGAANSAYSHFYTDRPAFFFSKPLYINGGVIGSYGQSDLQLRTADTPRLTIDTAGHVGIGTDNPQKKLDVNGDINSSGTISAENMEAEEITVTVPNGADFVFDEGYELRSLEELQEYIKQNKHLPEIQSEQEMKENGVSVNKFQIMLLQKIEELTLYTIQQEERIKELETKILIK